MTTERMLELILLQNIAKGLTGSEPIINRKVYITDGKLIINRKVYSLPKLYRRLQELEEEFLNPYVIDNAEKSE